MSHGFTIIGPAFCGLVYFATSAAFYLEGRSGWGLAYFAYGLANVGLIWASVE